MLCKGCSEPIKGIVGETCPICGTVYVKDEPAKAEKLKAPLPEGSSGEENSKEEITGIRLRRPHNKGD